MAKGDFLPCAICHQWIPHDRDDTVVWSDIRVPQKEGPAGSYGPFFTGHPDCFAKARALITKPCPSCDHGLGPVDSASPGKLRVACGTCKREFEQAADGKLIEVAKATPAVLPPKPAPKRWFRRR